MPANLTNPDVQTHLMALSDAGGTADPQRFRDRLEKAVEENDGLYRGPRPYTTKWAGVMPGIREHQRHWPLYTAMSVIIENADGYGHSYTRIGKGPDEVTPFEAKKLLMARYVTQFSDQFGTALEPTRKGRDYWEQADEAFMKLGARGRNKKKWMKRYEELTGNPQPKPHDYWDTATYLFNQGLSPEEASGKFKKRGSARRVAARYLKASTNTECDFYKATNGKWYMDLESYEEDWDTGEQIEGEMTSYGPFSSFKAAEKFLERNFANPGGYFEDDSGRRRPPRNPVRPSRFRRWAYSYSDDVGGTLSWEVRLGGDAENWRVVGAKDSRSWQDILRQITRAFKGIRTRHGGVVEGVQVGRGSNTLRVYFNYTEDIDADDALYDAEDALKREIKTLSDRDLAYEWVLHGSVHGVQRSSLEIGDEAIEAGFDTGRMASKTANFEGVSRRKVVKVVNHVIDQARLRGFFHDQHWAPVHRIWKDFDRAGILWSITKTEYQHEVMGGQRVPVRKVWRFEVPYTNERGKPGVVYGQVVAAGAGPVDDPLETYDVTAYVS